MALEPKPAKTEVLEDNARKFTCAPLPTEFLKKNSAQSYRLVTNWTKTNESTETKVVLKHPANAELQHLLISKTTVGGNRTTEKKKITKTEYEKLLPSSVAHLEKSRHEFPYTQNGVVFTMKYDEFTDGRPPVLEVDAESDGGRQKFDPTLFPFPLTEVTGDLRYYGFRAATLSSPATSGTKK